ncbi:MAG: hypothetical protein COB30_019670 [Ectothiorhodospiraceae bacterium]|nr:hypothetical protein [Ectothiorhodospiraceae bacterium]
MDFKITQQEGIQLVGKLVGSTVSVDYTAMLYEQPADNGCFLSIWQDTQIPFGKAGDPTNSIIGNERTGSQVFDQLTTNVPYIVGWGAGNTAGTSKPNYGSIGASVSFTPGGDEDSGGIVTGVSDQVSITPALVSANSIVATFDSLDGNNPSENGNWIGLWQGSTIDFDGGYLEKWDVTSTNNSDSQGLNVTQAIRSGSTYTLAYASGPNKSDIVARVTFKTSGY